MIATRLAQRTAAEWLKVFREAEVPSSLVQTLSEVVADPQVESRGSLLPVPGSRRLHSVRSPFRLASVPQPRNRRCPHLGMHTREVLHELGLPDQRIMELAQSGVVQLGAATK